MFGRNPRLPIDLVFGLQQDMKEPTGKYIQDLRDRLTRAYQLASEAAKRAQAKQQEGYNAKVRGASVTKGDRVLVKIVSFDGKHKLSDKWEQEPYIVLDQPNSDIPVFTVQRESGEGRKRTLHRNLLLPVGYISETTERHKIQHKEKPIPKPRSRISRPRPAPKPRPPITQEQNADQQESSDEEQLELIEIEPVSDDNSDRTITEVTSSRSGDDTETQMDDSEGDAHSHEGTESSAERSTTLEEVDDEQQEEQPDESFSPSSPEPLRRSTRERKPPAWMSSGQYDLCKSVGSAVTSREWFQKVQCLTSLAETNLFHNLQAETAKSILDIMKATSIDQK